LTDAGGLKRGSPRYFYRPSAYRRAGLFEGEVATRANAVKQAIAVTRQTLKDFAASGPTEKEMADAKTYLTGSASACVRFKCRSRANSIHSSASAFPSTM
jgi:hypothetical protein